MGHGHYWDCDYQGTNCCHHYSKPLNSKSAVSGVRVIINLRNTNPAAQGQAYISHRTEEITLELLDEYQPEFGWVTESIKIGSFI